MRNQGQTLAVKTPSDRTRFQQGAPITRSWQRLANYFGIGEIELLTTAVLLVASVAFRIVDCFRWRFNPDEPQHAHVIWGWAHGFVQYRDLFDNHMPLFHIMFAPVFGLLGERATILFWMRFFMLPMYFVAAWCTYRIGTLLFSRRAGIWAVILAGFYPGYYFVSLEFRPDNLWALFWLLCLVVLLERAITTRRALAAGLLLGFCFGVSMKSSLLLLAILIAAPFALMLVGPGKLGFRWSYLFRCLAAFLIGTALVPAIIIITFASKHLWPQFRYCVFEHNLLSQLNQKGHPAWMALIFPLTLPFLIYSARMMARVEPDPVLAFRRSFIFLICGFYLSTLYSFWSLITRQDFLPYHPLAFVIGSGALLALARPFNNPYSILRRILAPIPLLPVIAMIEFVVSLLLNPLGHNGAAAETDLLRGVLRLTDPSDYVFDCKGETIFRQRCFRPVMEDVTRERIRRGFIPDDAPEYCIKSHTCVASMVERMSLRAAVFLRQNYLPVGSGLRVAGLFLQASDRDPRRDDFDVVIPASYEIISRDSLVTGFLDGTPYQGARFLWSGKHTFIQTSAAHSLALLWAKAVERNFNPFRVARSMPRA